MRHTSAMVNEKSATKVYFAGPDVFEMDARERLVRLQDLATAHGLQGLVPVDEAGAEDGAANAARICRANLALLRQADAVVANLQAFRGLEPDSGTAFEVGFAVAQGIPVVAYGIPSGTYAERVGAAVPCARDGAGVLREIHSGAAVEDFGLSANLMLCCTAKALVGTAEEAIARVAELVKASR